MEFGYKDRGILCLYSRSSPTKVLKAKVAVLKAKVARLINLEAKASLKHKANA